TTRSRRSSRKRSAASLPRDGWKSGVWACPASTGCAAPGPIPLWKRSAANGASCSVGDRGSHLCLPIANIQFYSGEIQMVTEGLKGRDFLRVQDFTKAELETMLELGLRLKGDNTF